VFSCRCSQAADGGGARGGAAAGQPDPHAAAAGGLPEDHQPAADPGPAVPAEQLAVRPAEPAAVDREHRQDQRCVGLRVERRHARSLQRDPGVMRRYSAETRAAQRRPGLGYRDICLRILHGHVVLELTTASGGVHQHHPSNGGPLSDLDPLRGLQPCGLTFLGEIFRRQRDEQYTPEKLTNKLKKGPREDQDWLASVSCCIIVYLKGT